MGQQNQASARINSKLYDISGNHLIIHEAYCFTKHFMAGIEIDQALDVGVHDCPPAKVPLQLKVFCADSEARGIVKIASPVLEDQYLLGKANAAATVLYQSSVNLTRLVFPNQLQNDSRWRTEGRLPWGLPLQC